MSSNGFPILIPNKTVSMIRCHLYAPFLLLLMCIALPADSFGTEDPNVAFLEMSGSKSPEISGIQGGFGLYDDHTALLAGISLLGAADYDDLFAGLNMGVRFHPFDPFVSPVTPFIGLGGFVGYSWEEVPAEDDEIDNDEDGEVDEEDETKNTVTNSLSAIYPEVGIHFVIMGEGLLTIAARYNVTTKGRDFDHWMVTLGFSFPLYFQGSFP